MNKQLLFLLAVFLCGLLSYGQIIEANGINYWITDAVTKRVEVTINTDYTGDAVIPTTVTDNGVTYRVTGIGDAAFRNCTGLTSVSIPNSVESIEPLAFTACTSLASVNIPDSVTDIGAFAFHGCTGLNSIVIPNSITKIKQDAFSNSGLTSMIIPDSVTSIERLAFSDCEALASVDIPNSVMDIKPHAFRNTGLISINIPDSVTIITFEVFSGCLSLTSVNIPDSVRYIGSSAFLDCSSLTSIHIPDSVINIEDLAFKNTGLTSVSIPDSVTNIGENVFSDCTALTSVTVAHISPLVIDSNVFDNVNIAGVTLNVPAGSGAAYRAADVWKDFGTVLNTKELQKDLNVFSMYPVPNNGILNIKSTVYDAFQIINQYGQEVKRFTVIPGIASKINTGFLSDGVYYVKAVQGGGTKKLVVER